MDESDHHIRISPNGESNQVFGYKDENACIGHVKSTNRGEKRALNWGVVSTLPPQGFVPTHTRRHVHLKENGEKEEQRSGWVLKFFCSVPKAYGNPEVS